MKKRILSMLMVVVLTVGLLPVGVFAASSDCEEQIYAIADKVVKDHARKVYQSDADEEAFADFFVHGFFGNSKDMILNDSSPMTAAIFNSCLMQEFLPKAITKVIVMAEDTNQEIMNATGSASWHDYGYGYGMSAFFGGSWQYKDGIGSVLDESYKKQGNANDQVQELLTGSMWVKMKLQRMEVKENTAVYSIDLHIYDEFDFTTDYSDVVEAGYDTSKDQRLVNLGWMMRYIGLDDFYWEYKTSFCVEVPYECDHVYSSYQWTYDAPKQILTSHGSDGYSYNQGERKTYNYTTKNSKGETVNVSSVYYDLPTMICLEHDRPWVIEYDWRGSKNLCLRVNDSSQYTSVILFSGTDNVWAWSTDIIDKATGESAYSGSVDSDNTYSREQYVGVSLKDKFKYSSETIYRYILENVIAADGSNMICLTVINRDTGETLVGPEPMDNYWTRSKQELDGKRTLISESSNALSGKDFYIDHIGGKNYSLSKSGTMELRIWENGKDVMTVSSVSSAYVSPDCTAQGGVKNTCADCGYSYVTDAIPALGHSYGEYVSDNNATCTADGTKTRICTRCGGKDTVTDVGTALGHDFGDYIYNKDASCTEDGTQSRNCSRCTAAETMDAPDTATGHSHQPAVTAPTCTAQGYTTYTCHCGDSYKADYVDATGHNYQMTIVAPTCTEQGYTVYTCHCGDTYKADYTDETGHSPVIDAAVPASCIGNGLTEGSHCEVCGYVIKAQNTVIGGTHLKDGGTIIKEATYETPGTVMYQCIYCGEKSYVVLPKLDKPEPVVNPFTDVKESDWFYNPVMWAVQSGVTGGKTATTFAPNEGCTRAQVVTFLWAANGKPMPESAENPFTDIKEGDWYYNAVLWAVENGITGGISADKFGPNATCTRAQIATFLWAAQGKHAVSDLSGFSDVAAADWYATPVIWAKEQGITDGIGGGKFGPNDTCTRAQVVTFLNKVYG